MEEIKRKLVESGIIPRVLDDFNPRVEIILSCRGKRIGIGDEVTPREVQRHPICVEHYDDACSDVELHKSFENRDLVVLVMTDPDALGGEYLHWLTLKFLSNRDNADFPPLDLVAYERPRSGSHMLVLTLFNIEEFLSIDHPNKRAQFSTRTFADNNGFGWPLGASFFKIKYENEEEKQMIDRAEPSSYISSWPASCKRSRTKFRRRARVKHPVAPLLGHVGSENI